MAHIPHLVVGSGWHDATIAVDDQQRRHIDTVLRRTAGDPVTYTDGRGSIGSGTWTGERIERGEENSVPAPSPKLTVAVSPPDAKDRVRWLVEKSTELGIWRIRWLQTAHTQGRIPRHDRCMAWMIGAVEQSRGAWCTEIDEAWSRIEDLEGPVAAAQSGGVVPTFDSDLTVAVGPEGGWAPGELPDSITRFGLGDRILRTETAVVALGAVAATFRGPS